MLAQNGTITPNTRIEDPSGHIGLAKNVTGLAFPETAAPAPNPFTAPRPDAANPFTAAPPASDNPFVTTPSFPKTRPQRTPLLVSIGKFYRANSTFIKIALLVPLLLGMCAVVYPIVSDRTNRNDGSNILIKRQLEQHDLNLDCTDVTVTWTKKPSIYQTVTTFWCGSEESKESLSASGKFKVKAKPKEKLYESVYGEDGWRELSLTQADRDAFNRAKKQYLEMPESLRDDLPSLPSQFHSVVLSPDDELLVTGSFKLRKGENDHWQDGGIQLDSVSHEERSISPQKKRWRESQLGAADNKIDDPKTKDAINAIKNFPSRIEVSYDAWSIEEALKNRFADFGKNQSLEITDITERPEKFGDTISGKFTAKAKTSEKLYKKVDKGTVLERLEITNLYKAKTDKMAITNIFKEKLLEADFLNSLDFYELHIPLGTAITLTGTVKLSKGGNGDWQRGDAKVDTTTPALDGAIADSRLPENARRLDDPAVKSGIVNVVNDCVQWATAIVKHQDDFTRLCQPGAEFKGLASDDKEKREITITFESAARGLAEASGKVTFPNLNGIGSSTESFGFSLECAEEIKGRIEYKTQNDTQFYISFGDDTITLDMPKNILRRNNNRNTSTGRNTPAPKIDDPLRVRLKRTKEGSNAAKPDRDWIEPELAKWLKEHARATQIAKQQQIVAPQDVTPQNAAQRQLGNPQQNVGVQDAVDLADEKRKAGFNPNNYAGDDEIFVVYGTEQLRKDYEQAYDNFEQANPFRKKDAQKELDEVKRNIDKKRNEIGQKTFVVGPLSYWANEAVDAGDQSGLTMRVDSSVRYILSGTIKNVNIPNIPVSGVTVESITPITMSVSNCDIGIRISGRAAGIEKLLENEGKSYQVRVYFNNLRCRDKNSYTTRGNPVDANITRIEIFAKEQVPVAAPNAVQRENGRRFVPAPAGESFRPPRRQ